jgi:hypothetical protein
MKTFSERMEMIFRQRDKRAANVKEFEENKAVIDDGEPEQSADNGTAQENADRDSAAD